MTGWTFLPSLLTRFALQGFYTVFPHLQPRLPHNPTQEQVQRENAKANMHHRVARGLLVAAYLAYTIAAVYLAQSEPESLNFYRLTGMTREAVAVGGSSAVKAHWRKLARVYHPDKSGPSGEGIFVAMNRATQCLADDEKRWAYERFGPAVLDWRKLVTLSEFVHAGLQGTAVYYTFMLVTLLLVGVFRRDQQPYIHARLLLLLTTLSIELSLTVLSAEPVVLRLIFPDRLPFEHVTLVRQLFISGSLALAHIGPLLDPTSDQAYKERVRAEMDELRALLERIEASSEAIANEALALQHVQVDPFVPKTDDDERTKRRKAAEMADFHVRVQETVERIQRAQSAVPTTSIAPGVLPVPEAHSRTDTGPPEKADLGGGEDAPSAAHGAKPESGAAGDAVEHVVGSSAEVPPPLDETQPAHERPVSILVAPLDATSTPSQPPEELPRPAPGERDKVDKEQPDAGA